MAQGWTWDFLLLRRSANPSPADGHSCTSQLTRRSVLAARICRATFVAAATPSLPPVRHRSHTAAIPTDDPTPPLDAGAQRSIERTWSRLFERGDLEHAGGIRPFVRDSWARAIAAH